MWDYNLVNILMKFTVARHKTQHFNLLGNSFSLPLQKKYTNVLFWVLLSFQELYFICYNEKIQVINIGDCIANPLLHLLTYFQHGQFVVMSAKYLREQFSLNFLSLSRNILLNICYLETNLRMHQVIFKLYTLYFLFCFALIWRNVR